jgi:hypothetical protein
MTVWKTQILIRAALSALLLAAAFDSSDRRALAAQAERPRTVNDDQMPPGPQQAQANEERRKPTADEQSALDRAGGGNDRVKAYVKLAEARLRSARDAVTRAEYAAAAEQVAAYEALIADAGEFTKSSVPKRDKAHKTLEQALRVQLRLLEGVRRDTSAEYTDPVEQAIKTASRVRTQALDLLVGNGLFLSSPEEKKSSSESTPE